LTKVQEVPQRKAQKIYIYIKTEIEEEQPTNSRLCVPLSYANCPVNCCFLFYFHFHYHFFFNYLAALVLLARSGLTIRLTPAFVHFWWQAQNQNQKLKNTKKGT